MSRKKNLFDDEEVPSDITVNKQYAKSFQERKTLQDLQRLKDVEQEESSSGPSDSDEEDSDGIAATDVATQFLTILPMIAKKDPKVLKSAPNTAFFPQEKSASSDDEEAPATSKASSKSAQTPFLYKDMVRESILKKMQKGEESSSEDSEDMNVESDLPIAEQERRAKSEFLKAASQLDTNFEIQKREKSKRETEEEENEYQRFLSTRVKKGKDPMTSEIAEFWQGEGLSEEDKFLRNFILNKGWVDKQKFEVESESDSLEELEAAEDFEAKYNFRFEEPGANEILGSERFPQESMRKPDTKRKDARERKKERKEKAKKQKEDEKKRLLNLKKTEIIGRLEHIEEVAGTKGGAQLIPTSVLETDFDPETYDKEMEAIFNQDYYEEEELEKPTWSDDDEDAPQSFADKYLQKARELGVDEKQIEIDLNAYYDLNYEDMIGDQPVRFKYTEVKPYNWGLDVVDILEKDEKDLKKIVPIKRLAPYREDQGIVKKRKFDDHRPQQQQQQYQQRKPYNNSQQSYSSNKNNDQKPQKKGGWNKVKKETNNK